MMFRSPRETTEGTTIDCLQVTSLGLSNASSRLGDPKEIGCYSLDGNRRFRNDNSQVRYLVMPSARHGLHFDLNHGYSLTILRTFANADKLENLLRWIVANRKKLLSFSTSIPGGKTLSLKVDFVCQRGTLREIFAIPYKTSGEWIISATKFQGTIYLCTIDTEADLQKCRNMTPQDKIMMSWGYKFEQYMTSDKVGGKPDISSPVHQLQEHCIVVKNEINGHTLMYKAEMDAVDPSRLSSSLTDRGSTQHYTELKTTKEMHTDWHITTFQRYKLMNWWAQCALAGIPEVLCGVRNEQGIVTSLKVFQTRDIPSLGQRWWSSDRCINFCDTFLSFIKKCVTQDDPRTVFKFYWNGRPKITCTKLYSPGKYEILPEWYIREMEDPI